MLTVEDCAVVASAADETDTAAAEEDDFSGANGDDDDDGLLTAGSFVGVTAAAGESAAGPHLPEAFIAGNIRSVNMARRSCLALPPERRVV